MICTSCNTSKKSARPESCFWSKRLLAMTLLTLATTGAAWADGLDIDRASWSNDRDRLTVRGDKAPDNATVTIRYGNKDDNGAVIGTTQADGDGDWDFRISGNDLGTVPCDVTAQADGDDDDKQVRRAPRDCSNDGGNQPPPANVTPTANANGPYTGNTGVNVSFSSAGSNDPDGNIAAFNWDFGDGGSSNNANPNHAYAQAGTYNVTLTVTDNEGAIGTDTTTATIADGQQPPPPPPPPVGDASINSTSQNDFPAVEVAEQAFAGNTAFKVFANNDLGMHCGDFDTRISSVLPPFNVLHTQVIQRGAIPTIMTPANGVGVVYSAASNPADPILTGINSAGTGPVLSSLANNGTVFKTNWWDTVVGGTEPTALAAYRAFYPPGILDAFAPAPDQGLPMPNNELLHLGDGTLAAEQQDMPGRIGPFVENAPQNFTLFAIDQPFFINFPFGYTAGGVDWYEAAGIPLTAFDDAGRENPWPLYRVQATNGAGTVLASSDIVVPISGEANCGACHNAPVDGGNGSATQALGNNVATVLDDPEFDVSVPLEVSKEYAADLNLVRLHDLKHGSGNPNGPKYSPDLVDQTPVVCQSCHYTPALDLAQVGPRGPENDTLPGDPSNGRDQVVNKSMSNVMHSHHATVTDTNGNLLFLSMPPAIDANGNRRDPLAARDTLMNTCYQCHPGRRTDCLRGAMANGGMLCQDCHGDMEQVGDDFSRNVAASPPSAVGAFELANDFYTNPATPRVPWANEPGCGSCHTGDVLDNKFNDVDTLGDSADGIRLLQAYRIGDTKATPIVPTNNRFAENIIPATFTKEDGSVIDNNGAGNPMLYRVSKGHGGVYCEACHGATHGIWPNKNPDANDNVAAVQLQGHTGTITECDTCHSNINNLSPDGSLQSLQGPHGMHVVGETAFADGDHKQNWDNNTADTCRACHGQNGEGSVLSRTATDRDFTGMKDGGPVAKGTPVTCTMCHGNEL